MSPVEQRVYGLIHVATGLWMIVFGKYTPSWTLSYVMKKAVKNSRVEQPRFFGNDEKRFP